MCYNFGDIWIFRNISTYLEISLDIDKMIQGLVKQLPLRPQQKQAAKNNFSAGHFSIYSRLTHDVYCPHIKRAKIQHHFSISFDLGFSKYASLLIRLTTCKSWGKSRHVDINPRQTKLWTTLARLWRLQHIYYLKLKPCKLITVKYL